MARNEVDRTVYIQTVERIIERMEAEGLVPYSLSKAIGRNTEYIRGLALGITDDIARKKAGYPSLQTLRNIAGTLRTSVAYLTGDIDDPGQTDSPLAEINSAHPIDRPQKANLRLRQQNVALPVFTDRSVPKRAAAAGGLRGGFLMSEDPIDYAARPSAIANARDVWMFEMVDNSMSPAFEIRDPVYVNPNQPIAEGDYVAVTLVEGKGEMLLRQLKKADESYYTLVQLKPVDAKPLRLRKAEVAKIERVMRYPELLAHT